LKEKDNAWLRKMTFLSFFSLSILPILTFQNRTRDRLGQLLLYLVLPKALLTSEENTEKIVKKVFKAPVCAK
jgi:hypothetical protein